MTHEWDRSGERCVKCGAKDWMGGVCSDASACKHDYEAPVRKGRADYRCRLCGADITAELVLIAEADKLVEESEEGKRG